MQQQFNRPVTLELTDTECLQLTQTVLNRLAQLGMNTQDYERMEMTILSNIVMKLMKETKEKQIEGN